MDLFMILSAKYLFLFIIVIVLGYFLQQKKDVKKKLIVFTLISLPITFLVARILSMIFFDPRPFVAGHFVPLIPHDADNGFPSDHALLSFAFGFLLIFFNRNVGAALLVFAAIVGVSRIYVGVHSPIDIFGSVVVAFSIATITHLILKRVYR